METALIKRWTVEEFLAWEDRQEGRHEFDGERIIAMTGGSVAHQKIVFNLVRTLLHLLDPAAFDAVFEMRVRLAGWIRYPDVLVYPGHLDHALKILADAIVIFEVLSDVTARIDRLDKLQEYRLLPSLRRYVLLEQVTPRAVTFARDASWQEQVVIDGVLAMLEIGVDLPMADL
jgi:Uma2 family endonuclease